MYVSVLHFIKFKHIYIILVQLSYIARKQPL